MLGGLKVNLPHLSLSRNSSPSRGISPASTPNATQANDPLSTANSASIATNLSAGSAPTTPGLGENGDVSSKAAKRTTLGPLEAVLRRSSSFKANGNLTPSTALQPIGATASAPGSTRSASDHSGGLIPLQRSSGSKHSHHSHSGHSRRAVSGDRREHSKEFSSSRSKTLPNVIAGVANAPNASTATVGGLAQPASQPPMSRKTGKHSPTIHGSQTPTMTLAGPGAATSNAVAGSTPALVHQLEESYVSKVGLKLGEAVNKVFTPGSANAPGGVAEVTLNGRSAPRVTMAKQCGELVVQELQAALHDAYLLRTLLRSSVLKSLSLFLSRLTTLLLPADQMPPPPLSPKESDGLPAPLRFNLAIVRCAFELRKALLAACAVPGMPAFVRDTLRPWSDKLAEVMNRVMNPIITNYRIIVSGICAKARLPHEAGVHDGVAALMGGSALTTSLSGEEPGSRPTSSKGPTSQIRSLSMGRAAVKVPSILPHANNSSQIDLHAQGPLWLRELTAVLEAIVRLVARLECGSDGDKWLVSVGTHAVWKGMLDLSARKVNLQSSEPVRFSASIAVTHTTARTTSGLFKSSKRSPSPGDSPPLTPSLDTTPASSSTHLVSSASSCSASDVAFIRVLCELELLETRLIAFSKHLAVPTVTPIHPPFLSGSCDHELACGLCKTGRQFDDESDSEVEDDPSMTTESALAHSAMREAMQALSAMIVVFRASKNGKILMEAIRAEATVEMDQDKKEDSMSAAPKALTPMDLLKSNEPLVVDSQSTTDKTAAIPAHPFICPTLRHALATLPDLILLHLLASRCSQFALPHERWGLPDWRAYEKELRGFQAGEEWTAEVAWEMVNEVQARFEVGVSNEREKEALELVKEAARIKVGVEVNAS